MELKRLDYDLTVCKLSDAHDIDLGAEFFFIGKTDLLNTDQSKKERGESPRHKYGQYKNVLLSDEDFEKLKAEFPADYEDRIDNLSEYMASTGRSYKNHLVTIRRWSRRDAVRKPYQQTSSPTYSADRYETTKRRSL